MYELLRPLLFRMSPERAHATTLQLLGAAGRTAPLRTVVRALFAPRRARPVTAFGLTFPSPLGLAAGYDKDADAIAGLAVLGFGHVEVGTVTPAPQPGNPRPRLFRLPEDRAVINRLGFPSRGAEAVAARLRERRPPGIVVGVNLGKQKDTPLEAASDDYCRLLRTFAPLGDYLVINVSSPNTLGLRRLQAREALASLLTAVAAERGAQAGALGRPVPVLVKLAPDLSDPELDDALDAVISAGMDGVIATNTTLSREGLRSPRAAEAGGLSGAPLRARSTRVIREIHDRTAGRLPIIGVGGIATADDARAKIDAGARLVQLYTGLIYEGPGAVRRIVEGLA